MGGSARRRARAPARRPPQRCVAFVAALLLALLWWPFPTPAAAATLPEGFSDHVVATDLDKPTSFDFAPDGRLFVAEQRGVIKVFDDPSDTTPHVFADLRTQVHHYFDRGLLGMVVDPEYPDRPYVYVHYVADTVVGGTIPTYGEPGADADPCPRPDMCPASLHISRLRADEAGDTLVSETVLIDDVCRQFAFHDGGGMAVGADGALYATVGDSAYPEDYGWIGEPPNPCGDPPTAAGVAPTLPSAEGGVLRSQDLRTTNDPAGLSGTVIRIDPDGGLGFAGNASIESADLNEQRVIAYGLRNPFRVALRPGTDEVWVGDVGAGGWEEVDRIANAGAPIENFGWPCYEGAARHAGVDALDASICENLYAEPEAVSAPWFAYSHASRLVEGEACNPGSSAITALDFYAGGGYPAQYEGALFFADVYRGCIWAMHAGPDGLPVPGAIETFMTGVVTPTDLRTGPGGDLYYTSVATGTVHRIHYDPSNQPPHAAFAGDPTSGEAPLTVSFDAATSFDTDPGDTLSYSWDLDGNGEFDDATTPLAQHTFETPGAHTVRVRVRDAAGTATTASKLVTVGSRPEPVIDAPTATTTWRVGDEITFAGHATDPTDGELSPSTLTWTVLLHHCYETADCHAHEVQQIAGTDQGSFVAPDHPWPARLELRLTATNAHGVRASTSVIVDAEPVQLEFVSDPPGLRLAAGATVAATPFTATVIAGSRLTVTAGSPQENGGNTYQFDQWSDAVGAAQRLVVADAPATYHATFHANSPPPVANAGPDYTVESGTAFALDGSLSNGTAVPLQYSWAQVSGPPVVLRDEQTPLAFADGIEGPATLAFQLTVTDDNGLVHTDTVVVTVRAPK